MLELKERAYILPVERLGEMERDDAYWYDKRLNFCRGATTGELGVGTVATTESIGTRDTKGKDVPAERMGVLLPDSENFDSEGLPLKSVRAGPLASWSTSRYKLRFTAGPNSGFERHHDMAVPETFFESILNMRLFDAQTLRYGAIFHKLCTWAVPALCSSPIHSENRCILEKSSGFRDRSW
jgi:hypothetical protein